MRVAIGIGDDVDTEMLEEFIANPRISVLRAKNPEQLVEHIRWVSTAVLQSASAPASGTASQVAGPAVPMPAPPPPMTGGEVW